MAIVSQVLQEGRRQRNCGLTGATIHISAPAIAAQPFLLPCGISPFSKELANENMEGKLTVQRVVSAKAQIIPSSQTSQETKGWEGAVQRVRLGKAVLMFTSVKWSFDGTQSSSFERFMVSRLQ